MSDTPRTGSGGLGASLRRLSQSLLGTLQTRFEILSADVGEERFTLMRAVVLALVALSCLQAGIFLAVLFVVLAVGDEHRLIAIGGAAGVLLLAAVAGALWLRHWLRTRPPMFAATIAELRKDRERMGGSE
jgi:uncharacterized membrane protein YqjE